MALAAQVDEGSESHRQLRAAPPAFADVYQETFAFVWRTARRLGVMDSAVDDVAQEVFVTVYRRLDQFEGRCSIKTWVFSILMGIVRNYRRSRRRKGAAEPISAAVVDPELLEDHGADPLEQATLAQAGRMVHQLLDEMTEDKAVVFVLAELEGLTVPEISDLVGANVNTVYSRLRAGRKEFDQALGRMRAREAENPL
jgi:RNA polymerase sigma-70 factor (ECF subfamily)